MCRVAETQRRTIRRLCRIVNKIFFTSLEEYVKYTLFDFHRRSLFPAVVTSNHLTFEYQIFNNIMITSNNIYYNCYRVHKLHLNDVPAMMVGNIFVPI